MKARVVLTGLAALLAAGPVLAQNGEVAGDCAALEARARDACQKTVDLFAFMTPQLGVSLAGGNALLGARSTAGGIGRVSVGLRGTVIQGKLPDVEGINFATTGAQRSEIETEDRILGAPGVEVAVGLFPGVDVGFARVGSLEGIVSANYIPEYDDESFNVEAPDGSLKLGFGGRLGLLGERGLLPGVAVTYLRRDLPTLNVRGVTSNLGGTVDDTLALEDFSVKTTAIRAVVSKSVAILGLAAGIGQDTYDASARLNTVVRSAGTVCSPLDPCVARVRYAEDMTRTTMFANATLNLILFRLGAEVGQVSGGDVATYNSFEDRDPNDKLLYGSVAIRFGF